MVGELNPLMRDLIDNPDSIDEPSSKERFSIILDAFDGIAAEILLLSPPDKAVDVQVKAEEFAENLNAYTHFTRYTLGIGSNLDNAPTKVILMHEVHSIANELHSAGVGICR